LSHRSIRNVLSVSLLAVLSALAVSCLDHPRNGQSLDTKTSIIAFDGWYAAPQVAITLWIKNHYTGQWEAIQHAPILTGTNALTDNAGDDWYYYSASDVVLPQGGAYWPAGPGRTIKAVVKATGPGNYLLTTFDVDADTCIEENKPLGGAAIMEHCGSASSPEVMLKVACGAASQACCRSGEACDFGRNCTAAQTCSAACGAQGQACCLASPGCGASTICKSGTCAHCGNTGESCCSGSTCAANNVCSGGTCASCGGGGQLCCSGSKCGAGFACDGTNHCQTCGGNGQLCCPDSKCGAGLGCDGTNHCQTCGGNGQVCCANNTCGSGLSCNTGTDKCEPCGGSGELCCSGSTCDNGSLACQGGRCKTCGDIGGPCCGGSCNGSAVCSGGSCVACGGAYQPCCNQTTCGGGLFCSYAGTALAKCEPCGKQGQPCCYGDFGCDNSAPYCTDVYSAGKYTCQSQPSP
jgi:hypothetical protein